LNGGSTMGEYLSPGLFLSERKSSAGPVAAVSTSTFGTVGWLQKGPENDPQLVTSFAQFIDIFGSYWRNSFVPFQLAGFFQNGGARAYVTRVTPSDAVKATGSSGISDAAKVASFVSRPLPATTDLSTDKNIGLSIDGGAAADIDASAGAVAPAAVTPSEIAAAIDLTEGITCTLSEDDKLNIVSDTPGATSSLVFTEATANDNSAAILGLAFGTPYADLYTYSGAAASDWTTAARWKGAWYNQVRMCISGNPDYADGDGGFTRFDVYIDEESAVGEADWENLESYEAVVMDDDTSDFFVEEVINNRTKYNQIVAGVTFGIPSALMPVNNLAEYMEIGDGAEVTFSGILRNIPLVEGSLSVQAGAIAGADDSDGSIAGTGISAGTIDYTTGAWSITFTVAPTDGDPILGTYFAAPASTEVCCQLTGGVDGVGPITRGDVTDPALEADKLGLYAFNSLDEILNIAIPDFAGDTTVAGDMIAYAEDKKNRFVILTTPIATGPQDAVKFVRVTAQYNTSYSALYYPWVKIYDPIANDGRDAIIPPDGFIAGMYGRTDNVRNVGKAPAGITDGALRGVTGLERVLDKGERDILYPARINPLVSSPQTGLAVWGARTLSKDAEWLFVNARRLFMFCEQSIYNANFWVCFENNGPALWSRMKAQGEGFFLNLFRDGYFAGARPSDAFAIVIDSSNNPQESIDAGIVTADYYIASNRPAEFVRLRFQQKVR
jgi:phage tail sheath protein FI